MNEHLEWTDPALEHVADIRQWVLDRLDGPPSFDTSSFATAVTEVLTNAAERTLLGADPAMILLELSTDRLRITNPSVQPAPEHPLPADPEAERGRGMLVAAALWPNTTWAYDSPNVVVTMELSA